ncbi:MAG: bifunctional 3-deoxy-7-phosphoheptulonate synthase/chorismate mutase type II [Salibacteraceae bacterium]
MSIENIHIVPSHKWLAQHQGPMIIAGPCSAESENQIMQVAEHFSQSGNVSLIRAGVWKPRTRPNSFEGIGATALPWIKKAQDVFGIPFIIEVATADHARKALNAGIHHLWVGARTTVNPFSVQEIADALEGTDIPVFVKNPLNPDLQLWVGALERFSKAGLHKLVAVHRGFNTYQDHVFRNSPNWEIPIELKTKLPELEIIVDPSHISGNRSLLHEVSQKALDLAFDGLMIEVHPEPNKAMSDPKQQLALADFNAFITSLETKRQSFGDAVSIDKLERLRSLIDEIDYNLIENLKRRLEIVDEIGAYKAASGVAVFQLERWLQILTDRQAYAVNSDVDHELIKELWSIIHSASIKKQTKIINSISLEKNNFDA